MIAYITLLRRIQILTYICLQICVYILLFVVNLYERQNRKLSSLNYNRYTSFFEILSTLTNRNYLDTFSFLEKYIFWYSWLTKKRYFCCNNLCQIKANRNAIYNLTHVLSQRMRTRRWQVVIVMTFAGSCLQLKWSSKKY